MLWKNVFLVGGFAASPSLIYFLKNRIAKYAEVLDLAYRSDLWKTPREGLFRLIHALK